MNVKQQSKAVQAASLTPSQAGVGLLHKAFELLNLFQVDQANWSQSEIIEITEMSRSTVSRLVRYLVETGYLAEIPKTGRYSLGMAAISLGQRAEAGFDLKSFCQPALAELAEITNETIVLTAFDRKAKSAVCIDQLEGERGGLRVFEKVGAAFPLHAGAAPRVILAALPVKEQDAYLLGELPAFTPRTLISPENIRKDIIRIKDDGYCLSIEETYLGAAGMAACFTGPDNYPAGSIAIAFPLHNMDDVKKNNIGIEIARIAESLSQKLKA
ncbi:IclR family transcriptional regulator [Kiloniella majae]|uniref:IclR family transcriptional regulator n=1 Tax=Kiloniella majae TaxID=1938558 RepID=UPI0015C4FBB5|nr:IclR family transcriptional regulator [Kiloniella majae]